MYVWLSACSCKKEETNKKRIEKTCAILLCHLIIVFLVEIDYFALIHIVRLIKVSGNFRITSDMANACPDSGVCDYVQSCTKVHLDHVYTVSL